MKHYFISLNFNIRHFDFSDMQSDDKSIISVQVFNDTNSLFVFETDIMIVALVNDRQINTSK